MPVALAFGIGGFAGAYTGVVVGVTENIWLTYVVFAGWAMLVGFPLSRVFGRYFGRRRGARQRAAR